MSRIPSSVLQSLVAKLAPGFALGHRGGVLDGVLGAIAEPISDVEKGAAELMVEVDPRSSEQLLPDFQRVLGPDPCGRDLRAMTLIDRQRIAHQRWTAIGGQSLPYLIEVAAKLGVRIEVQEGWPSDAGELQAGGDVVADGEQFLWRILLEPISEAFFNAGAGQSGEPLGRVGISEIECEIRRIAHAHTVTVFSYTLLPEPDPVRRASHLYDFVVDRGQVRLPGRHFVSARAGELLALSRASAGTYLAADGLLKTAPANAPRIQHDRGGQPLGLLHEAEANKLVLWSEQLDRPAHGKTNVAVEADVAIAPDGTFSADRVRDTGAAVSPHFLTATINAPKGALVTFSGFLKAETHSAFRLQLNAFGGHSFFFQVDLATGSVGSSAASANAEQTACHLARLPSDWWFFELVGICNAADAVGTGMQGSVNPLVNGSIAYSGEAGASYLAWGLGGEIGGRASSYLRTEGAAVTRSADRIAVLLPDEPRDVILTFADGSSASIPAVAGMFDLPAQRQPVRSLFAYSGA